MIIFSDTSGPCASLYQNRNYGGWKEDVKEGEGQIRHINDQVSSVRVRPGCTFKAYRNFNFDHEMFTSTEDNPSLHDSHNDHMSAYRCSCAGKYFNMIIEQ